jgi:type I site-specific restriction endonuclease
VAPLGIGAFIGCRGDPVDGDGALTTEADTCRIRVLPGLYSAGWTDEQIREQVSFTPGRIIVSGRDVERL